MVALEEEPQKLECEAIAHRTSRAGESHVVQ